MYLHEQYESPNFSNRLSERRALLASTKASKLICFDAESSFTRVDDPFPLFLGEQMIRETSERHRCDNMSGCRRFFKEITSKSSAISSVDLNAFVHRCTCIGRYSASLASSLLFPDAFPWRWRNYHFHEIPIALESNHAFG